MNDHREDGHESRTEPLRVQEGQGEPEDVSTPQNPVSDFVSAFWDGICLNRLYDHGDVGPCLLDTGHHGAHDDGAGIAWTRSVR